MDKCKTAADYDLKNGSMLRLVDRFLFQAVKMFYLLQRQIFRIVAGSGVDREFTISVDWIGEDKDSNYHLPFVVKDSTLVSELLKMLQTRHSFRWKIDLFYKGM